MLRRREPDLPRPYRVPGYPVVPMIFVIFAGVYLVLSAYNDVTAYQRAAAAGQPAFINAAFGIALILAGTPIYFFYRWRQARLPK